MKLRMIASLLTLLLVVILVIGGITTAWFTGKDSPPSAAAFLIGTVDIDITGEVVEPAEFRWEIKAEEDCRDFTWAIRNTGYKRVYLRAWLEETLIPADETAWAAQQNPGETIFPGASNWATYVTYSLGEGSETNVKTYPLFAGQYHLAGAVNVWNDNANIYVEYAAAGWEMSGVHLAVADDLGLIPRSPGGPVPGRFPFKAEFDELKETHSFTIPMQGEYPAGALEGREYNWTDPKITKLFIAAHADLIGIETQEAGMNWSQRECDFHWEYNETEKIWYYCLEPVLPGDEISLCLTGCPEKTGLYTVKLFAEAVQAHPEALAELWPGAPCLQGE